MCLWFPKFCCIYSIVRQKWRRNGNLMARRVFLTKNSSVAVTGMIWKFGDCSIEQVAVYRTTWQRWHNQAWLKIYVVLSTVVIVSLANLHRRYGKYYSMYSCSRSYGRTFLRQPLSLSATFATHVSNSWKYCIGKILCAWSLVENKAKVHNKKTIWFYCLSDREIPERSIHIILFGVIRHRIPFIVVKWTA